MTPKGTESTPTRSVSREPVRIDSGSSRIVPILMFLFIGLGLLMILFNYTFEIWGAPSSLYLLGGLGLILAGIVTATQYR
ncbi:MAG: hypothetical protein ACK5PP_18340 [Acidimicrobiales bacterium]